MKSFPKNIHCPDCGDDMVGHLCVECVIKKQRSAKIDRVTGYVEITRIEDGERNSGYYDIYGFVLRDGDWPDEAKEQLLWETDQMLSVWEIYHCVGLCFYPD